LNSIFIFEYSNNDYRSTSQSGFLHSVLYYVKFTNLQVYKTVKWQYNNLNQDLVKYYSPFNISPQSNTSNAHVLPQTQQYFKHNNQHLHNQLKLHNVHYNQITQAGCIVNIQILMHYNVNGWHHIHKRSITVN